MAGDVSTISSEIGSLGQAKPADEIVIRPDIRDLLPPLDQDAVDGLKESLQKHGFRGKLTTCKLDDQNVLLDGHYRYDLCIELGIPFDAEEIVLSNETEAKIWRIKDQRNKRNLNESQKAMLALELEAFYAEQAKETQGTRTDLGQTLDQSMSGRAAERAAKDMGISHGTVSYAKSVSNNGIPELIELVKSGNAPVSTAAKVAYLDKEYQKKIVERANSLIGEEKHPMLTTIIQEVVPDTAESANKRFGKVKKNLTTCQKLLEGIEVIQTPEDLAEMKATVEKITTRIKEIEAMCLDLTGQNTTQDQKVSIESGDTEAEVTPEQHTEDSEDTEPVKDKDEGAEEYSDETERENAIQCSGIDW